MNNLENKKITNSYSKSLWFDFKDDLNNVYLRKNMYTLSFHNNIRRNLNDAYYDISNILKEISIKVNNRILGRRYKKCPNQIAFYGFHERSDIKLNDHIHFWIRISKDFNNLRGIKYLNNNIKYFTEILMIRKFKYFNYSLDIKEVKDSDNVLIQYMSKEYNKNTNDNLIVC
jgi:hypothetical protein